MKHLRGQQIQKQFLGFLGYLELDLCKGILQEDQGIAPRPGSNFIDVVDIHNGLTVNTAECRWKTLIDFDKGVIYTSPRTVRNEYACISFLGIDITDV